MAQVSKQEKLDALAKKGVDLVEAKLDLDSTHKDLDAAIEQHGVVLDEEEKSNSDTISETEAGLIAALGARVTVLEEQLAKVLALPSIHSQVGASHISAPKPSTPAVVAIPAEPAESSVTFVTNSKVTPKRVFTKEEHGDSFNDVANEFHKNNQAVIVSRTHDADADAG